MISKKECLAMGGHCYREGGFTILTNSPIAHRVCKHCGHTQEGISQPSIKWEDERGEK